MEKNEPKRYYCGNGEGMFEDDKNGHWVEYSEHKAIMEYLLTDKNNKIMGKELEDKKAQAIYKELSLISIDRSMGGDSDEETFIKMRDALNREFPIQSPPKSEGDVSLEYYRELESRREVAKNYRGQVAGHHPDLFTSKEMDAMTRGFMECYNRFANQPKEEESIKLLRDLADLQNGAPLERHRKEWEETMEKVYAFLNKNEPINHPDK